MIRSLNPGSKTLILTSCLCSLIFLIACGGTATPEVTPVSEPASQTTTGRRAGYAGPDG